MGAGEESPEESKSRSGCAYARPGARCWARRRSNELAFPNSMGGDWMRGTRVESAAERRKNTVSLVIVFHDSRQAAPGSHSGDGMPAAHEGATGDSASDSCGRLHKPFPDHPPLFSRPGPEPAHHRSGPTEGPAASDWREALTWVAPGRTGGAEGGAESSGGAPNPKFSHFQPQQGWRSLRVLFSSGKRFLNVLLRPVHAFQHHPMPVISGKAEFN
ncbi:hypothetical protein K456DRAFT_1938180 [Colletotrichum gloeosporioides 23]|nr:hypothetical protein K456DRAFT_1938180 [Colletotrichum gloeosporioides 23]